MLFLEQNEEDEIIALHFFKFEVDNQVYRKRMDSGVVEEVMRYSKCVLEKNISITFELSS